MSLLSQFFPSGGGGFSIAQKIDLLIVGGGGGAGASGGNCQPKSSQPQAMCLHAQIGGGGGGGQVVFSDAYEIIQDTSYPITIGAGGAGGGFYYDTTNIYIPRKCVVAPAPLECFPTMLQGGNAATLRGADGGNTTFGSIIAYGGGGGGGGVSLNLVPATLQPAACIAQARINCSELSSTGRTHGTGGGSGSGSCGQAPGSIRTESQDITVVAGKGIYNESISFLKTGSNGVKFKVPSNFPVCLQASTSLTFATGGGGNNVSGTIAGSELCLQTPESSVSTFTGPTFSCDSRTAPGSSGFYSVGIVLPAVPYQADQRYGYAAALNAFMEGAIGSGGNHNQYVELNDYQSSLRGTDGHRTVITPTPEYFGGGGGVAYAAGPQGCRSIFMGTIVSPDNPCYPSPVWLNDPRFAPQTCPYGGAGGGGSVSIKCTTCLPSAYNAFTAQGPNCTFPGIRVVGLELLTDIPVPSVICPGAGVDGKGGGGASFYGGCQMVSTGDVFPNPTSDPGGADTCAYCGYAGGSGTVIIRYPTVFSAATVTGNTPITAQTGYHIYKWTTPGTITFPS